MTCPKCDLPKIVGAAKCACGYRFHEDDSGRPRLNEMTELPRARRSNGGMAMLFGLALAAGGGYLAYQAYGDRAPNTDMRIETTAVGEGSIDWAPIFRAAGKAGITGYYVEVEPRGASTLDAVKVSCDYLRKLEI